MASSSILSRVLFRCSSSFLTVPSGTQPDFEFISSPPRFQQPPLPLQPLRLLFRTGDLTEFTAGLFTFFVDLIKTVYRLLVVDHDGPEQSEKLDKSSPPCNLSHYFIFVSHVIFHLWWEDFFIEVLKRFEVLFGVTRISNQP